MERHIRYLRELFAMADFHIQTEPVCSPARVDLTTFPMSRKVKRPAYC